MFIINHSEWGLNECDPATSLSGTLLPSGKRRTVHVSKSLYRISSIYRKWLCCTRSFWKEKFWKEIELCSKFPFKIYKKFAFSSGDMFFFPSIICSILDMKFVERINKQHTNHALRIDYECFSTWNTAFKLLEHPYEEILQLISS